MGLEIVLASRWAAHLVDMFAELLQIVSGSMPNGADAMVEAGVFYLLDMVVRVSEDRLHVNRVALPRLWHRRSQPSQILDQILHSRPLIHCL